MGASGWRKGGSGERVAHAARHARRRLVSVAQRMWESETLQASLGAWRGRHVDGYAEYERVRRMGQGKGTSGEGPPLPGRYLLWNQSSQGFLHQLTTCTLGLALARSLGRDAILNHVRLASFHNRDSRGRRRIAVCNPRTLIDFSGLQDGPRVITLDELGDLDALASTPARHLDRIAPGQDVDAPLLVMGRIDREVDYFVDGTIPPPVRVLAERIACQLDFAPAIHETAAAVSRALGDYDGLHVRLGDTVGLKQRLLGHRYKGVHTPRDLLHFLELLLRSDGLGRWIETGRTLFIATDHRERSLFAPLAARYRVRFLEDVTASLPASTRTLLRSNEYFAMGVEALVLVHARRFVGTTLSQLVLEVDRRRGALEGQDRRIYNLALGDYQRAVERVHREHQWYRGPGLEDFMARRS